MSLPYIVLPPKRGRPFSNKPNTTNAGTAINIKVPDEYAGLRERFRIGSVAAGMKYYEYLAYLLDKEESRITRHRAQMVSPLHRPTAPIDDD